MERYASNKYHFTSSENVFISAPIPKRHETQSDSTSSLLLALKKCDFAFWYVVSDEKSAVIWVGFFPIT